MLLSTLENPRKPMTAKRAAEDTIPVFSGQGPTTGRISNLRNTHPEVLSKNKHLKTYTSLTSYFAP